MYNIKTDESNPRRYTDAVIEYIENFCDEQNFLYDLLTTALYWLDDNDVKRFAEVNLDIEFDSDEEEI